MGCERKEMLTMMTSQNAFSVIEQSSRWATVSVPINHSWPLELRFRPFATHHEFGLKCFPTLDYSKTPWRGSAAKGQIRITSTEMFMTRRLRRMAAGFPPQSNCSWLEVGPTLTSSTFPSISTSTPLTPIFPGTVLGRESQNI